MSRYWRISLVAVALLAIVLVITPAPAQARWFARGYWGGRWGWGGGWGPGWGMGWGPGWWGPGYYGYGYWGPPTGKIHITAAPKDAFVYVDGGYAGTLEKMKKFSLRPGNHEIVLREPNGKVIYNQRVQVMRGHTTDIQAPFPG